MKKKVIIKSCILLLIRKIILFVKSLPTVAVITPLLQYGTLIYYPDNMPYGAIMVYLKCVTQWSVHEPSSVWPYIDLSPSPALPLPAGTAAQAASSKRTALTAHRQNTIFVGCFITGRVTGRAVWRGALTFQWISGAFSCKWWCIHSCYAASLEHVWQHYALSLPPTFLFRPLFEHWGAIIMGITALEIDSVVVPLFHLYWHKNQWGKSIMCLIDKHFACNNQTMIKNL